MDLQFELVNEASPGIKWKRGFDRVWPSYKQWFLSAGENARTDLGACRSRLSERMPELVDTYEHLCDLAGNDEVSSRFLSMVDPPPYLAGCSQLAWTHAGTALIRNYDFSPSLFEGVISRTEWVRPVIGVSEGTWGLLDGINADGLSVCLSFGGRKTVGKGFGIPLVIRYLLETCTSVPQACNRLKTLPVHMAYSITMLDKDSLVATVHLSPDRDPVVTTAATCTNHQLSVEWDEYATASRSVERKSCLDAMLEEPDENRESLVGQFLESPLYNDQFHTRFGTLYTAVYDPIARDVEFVWPSKAVRLGFNDFKDQIIRVTMPTSEKQTLAAHRDTILVK